MTEEEWKTKMNFIITDVQKDDDDDDDIGNTQKQNKSINQQSKI